MLTGGNIKAQMTKSSQISNTEKCSRNRRVIAKLFKTVYFMARKKWAIKNNFEDLIMFIKDMGDQDLVYHFNQAAKNATYISHFTIDEFLKIISDYLEQKLMIDLSLSSDFALLSDESCDEANRAQFSIFVRYIDTATNSPKEGFVCIRKLGTSKTSEALMKELEEMFVEKNINKSLIRFSGLDGTNAMSGEKKGLQRRIRHVSPYALYLNCRNHRLALCLVHLLKQYNDLEAVDALLLAIWKILHYSSVKQAVFENSQLMENLTPLKILKACTTRWLTHGETSIRVISRFKPLIQALDAIFLERKDPDAKGIRDQLLSPPLILMLLLLAEVLLPINHFCKFLQTRNLNYCLVMGKFKRLIAKLGQIKNELDFHDSVDTDLKYFRQAKDLLVFSKDATSLGRELRSSERINVDTDIPEKINGFITTVAAPMIDHLIKEITDAMKETSPVLTAFDLFNPNSLNKSTEKHKQDLEVLCQHYGQVLIDDYENVTVTAEPIVNKKPKRLENSQLLRKT